MIKKTQFAISGMHCSSCAFAIDGVLEDQAGVEKAQTNYAKQITEVSYDPEKISDEEIIVAIRGVDTNYDAEVKK